jgi:hypothetical protein
MTFPTTPDVPVPPQGHHITTMPRSRLGRGVPNGVSAHAGRFRAGKGDPIELA